MLKSILCLRMNFVSLQKDNLHSTKLLYDQNRTYIHLFFAISSPFEGHCSNIQSLQIFKLSCEFYETLAGVKLSEAFPAYGKTIIYPYMAEGLNRADCSLQTVRGELSSGWERKGSNLVIKVEIPFNCQSEVWIPVKADASVTESGKTIESVKEITLVKKEGNFTVYRIGSGSYRFEVRYPSGKS